MSHWRPTYPNRDRHASGDPSESNMPAESNWNLNTYIFKYTFFLIYINLNNGRTLIRDVGLWWVFDILGMSVSNVSPIRHIFWSLIRHVGVRPSLSDIDGLSIRHVDLRCGMSVSVQACRSPIRHVGLR